MNASLRILFPVFVILVSSRVLADSITTDVIFSDQVFVGAVDCSKLEGGDYCENEFATRDAQGALLKKKSKVVPACVLGGGDCRMVVFALEKKELSKDLFLLKVSTPEGEPVWIKTSKNDLKSVESMMPDAGEGFADLKFRPGLTRVYLDEAMTKPLPMSEVGRLPKGRELDPMKEHLQYVALHARSGSSVKVVGFQVNLVEMDTAAEEGDAVTNWGKGKKSELQKIYFPVFDSKGRVNYWPVPPSC